MQNKNQAWSEGETKNNKQKIYIGKLELFFFNLFIYFNKQQIKYK